MIISGKVNTAVSPARLTPVLWMGISSETPDQLPAGSEDMVVAIGHFISLGNALALALKSTALFPTNEAGENEAAI